MLHITTDIQTFDVQKQMARLAQLIYNKILENIKNGVNNDNEMFIPYSKSYAKIKGQNKVDLQVTGRMLSSLKMMFSNNEIIIGVVGDRNEVAEKLNQHKNWSFLTWGISLSKVYEDFLLMTFEENFKNDGNNGGQQ